MSPEPSLDQVLIFATDSMNTSEKKINIVEPTNTKRTPFLLRITALLSRYGVETHGIAPIPAAERVDTRWYQMFFMWFSANMNVLTFGVGTAGPVFFSLGVRGSIAIIVVVSIIFSFFPAFIAIFGPKLGTRAMVQSRFSWGYYGSIIPSILNVISMEGYLILTCIIGGQTLASLSPHLTDTLGIVIISLISLAVTFFGYRFLHWYQSISWLPNVIVFIAMLAVGCPQLHANQDAIVPTPTLGSVLSFASTVASGIFAWCPIIPDYGVYHSPAASSTRIFLYVYLSIMISSIVCMTLGAAFAAAAPNVPVWNAAFQNGTSAGGLLYGVLEPLGRFGKFLTLLVVLTVPSACVPTMYSFSTSLMSVARFFGLVPRWVYILLSEAILIPIGIVGAQKFYATLVDIMNIVGYWSAGFVGIVLAEHLFFRGASFSETAYPIATWDRPKLLPRVMPAVLAFFCAIGTMVPFISQTWYVGAVARHGSGDWAVYVSFVVSFTIYPLLRRLERWWDGRRGRGAETKEMGVLSEP